jgi:hypothetical protein
MRKFWITFGLILSIFALVSHNAAGDVRPEEIQVRASVDSGIVYHFPAGFEGAVDRLEGSAPNTLNRLRELLAFRSDRPIHVWVLPEIDDYFEARGENPRGPKWAVGLSLHKAATVIAINGLGPKGALVDLEEVVDHELVHAYLDLASGSQSLPRWFHEGFAVMVADKWQADRAESLARAAALDEIPSLESLETRFPGHHDRASVAYARSAYFVRYLAREEGSEFFARLLERLRNGTEWKAAFEMEAGHSVAYVDSKATERLRRSGTAWSILGDESLLFFGAGLVFLVALVFRRRRDLRRRAAMDEPLGDWDYDESRYRLPGQP